MHKMMNNIVYRLILKYMILIYISRVACIFSYLYIKKPKM